MNESNIGQVAVFTNRIGFGESVEAGKIELPEINGNSYAPFLFTYFTTNNWGCADDDVSGYNELVDGWVQKSSTKAPGMKLTPTVRSEIPGLIDSLRPR